jgi:rhodanese-related sulfurtransferase
LTAEQLRRRLEASTDMALIDVRNSSELGDGMIPGAVNVPLSLLMSCIGDFDPAGAVVVYCASGHRSMTAVSALRAAGFGDVSDRSADMPSGASSVSACDTSAGLDVPDTFRDR